MAKLQSVLDALQVFLPGVFVVLVVWLGARSAVTGEISAVSGHGERYADEFFRLERSATTDGHHFAEAISKGEFRLTVIHAMNFPEQSQLGNFDGDDQRDRFGVAV